MKLVRNRTLFRCEPRPRFLPLHSVCNVNKTFPLFVCLLLVLAACEADPTPVPSTPSVLSTTFPPTVQTPSVQPTASQNSTPAPSAPSNVSKSPTIPRAPSGSITLAGYGAPSREITTLPEFVSRALYDSLLRVNPQTGDLTPGLAERWLISEDAKTFVFMLRDDVVWHDGAPFTADDVVFTLRAFSSPDIRTNPAADFGPIAKINATDSRTVSITFEEAYCAALTYIGAIPILPAHRLQEKSLTNVANQDFIGTGPLVLKSWNDNAISFTRNERYWKGAPQILDWTYRWYENENAARAAHLRGQADLVVTRQRAANSNAKRALNQFFALALNVKRAPLDDVRVRQAIELGIDRAAVVPEEFRGDATLLQTSLLPNFWANTQNATQPAFNPQRARELLTSTGWRDTDGDGIVEKDRKSFQVTLWARADENRSEVTAQILRAQLQQIGVRAVLKLTDRILFLTRVFLEEYDLALAQFNIPLDPDQHYFWASTEDEPGFGLNVTGYRNTRVDEALDAGNRVARCEPTARKNAYAPVFQNIAQDVPMVFLFAPPEYLAANANVRGLAPSSFAGNFWNLEAWEKAP